MTIEVINNFLKEDNFKNIQDTLLGGWFPWYFTNGVSDFDHDNRCLREYQFTHTFFIDNNISSNWFTLFDEIIEKIKPSKIVKIKANLLTVSENNIIFDFHTDMPEDIKGKTAILYVNTNNGFTVFKDGTKISSVENRLVIFDSNIMHTGTTCSDKKTRCVINFNYIE
jgi:hypothetical protein